MANTGGWRLIESFGTIVCLRGSRGRVCENGERVSLKKMKGEKLKRDPRLVVDYGKSSVQRVVSIVPERANGEICQSTNKYHHASKVFE